MINQASFNIIILSSGQQKRFYRPMFYCSFTIYGINRTGGGQHISENVFQSDNGREFTAVAITELAALWPDLVLVYGRPRYPQSRGEVRRKRQLYAEGFANSLDAGQQCRRV